MKECCFVVAAFAFCSLWAAPDFRVEVRSGCDAWREVTVSTALVAKTVGTETTPTPVSFAVVEAEFPAEIKVTPEEPFTTAEVRPRSRGLIAVKQGGAAVFTVAKPENLTVDFDGKIFGNLLLFVSSRGAFAPAREGDLVFGPGLHRLPGGRMQIPSGTRVLVEAGAWVDGSLIVTNAENVIIEGRGVVRPLANVRDFGVAVQNSCHVKVRGLVANQCPVGGSDDVLVEDVKVISHYPWGDGFNVFASSNVTYRHIFARTSDDCMTVYATRKGFSGGCRNIRTEDAVLWADVAHPIMIGLHGNEKGQDVIEDVSYRDIDILDQHENQIEYQGCLAINCGDNNLIRRVRFEDVRIEDIRKGCLLQLRVGWNAKYCKAPGGGIDDVLFRNVAYNGSHASYSIISGYDVSRTVSHVQFENLRLNDELISDRMPNKPKWYVTSDMASIYVGNHVGQLTFD